MPRTASLQAVRRTKPPAFVEPMKPLLVESLPEGPDWSYEIKWDGYRALLWKHGNEVRLISRNDNRLDRDFPSIVAAGAELDATSCILDGEIVALGPDGRPMFQALQNRSTEAVLVFYAFDVLFHEGADLRDLTLAERRKILQRVAIGPTLRVSLGLQGTPSAVEAAVRRLSLEGVVAKRLDSTYVSGDRSNAWQKVRMRRGQEFVVGGYRIGGHPFESILVGYYEGTKLMFAGKVRAGFTQHTRRQLWDAISGDETNKCPFANLPDALKKGRWGEGVTREEMANMRWIRPKHVVEIEFVEWTNAGHLRHAAFKGIRQDKKPRDIVREETL